MNNRKTPFIRYGKGSGLLESMLGRYEELNRKPPSFKERLSARLAAFRHKFFS